MYQTPNDMRMDIIHCKIIKRKTKKKPVELSRIKFAILNIKISLVQHK